MTTTITSHADTARLRRGAFVTASGGRISHPSGVTCTDKMTAAYDTSATGATSPMKTASTKCTWALAIDRRGALHRSTPKVGLGGPAPITLVPQTTSITTQVAPTTGPASLSKLFSSASAPTTNATTLASGSALPTTSLLLSEPSECNKPLLHEPKRGEKGGHLGRHAIGPECVAALMGTPSVSGFSTASNSAVAWTS